MPRLEWNLRKKMRQEWEDELSAMSVTTEDRIAPRHALRELEKAMPEVHTNTMDCRI